MITAEKLKYLTTLPHQMLRACLGKQVKDVEFVGATFLGITNGGQFCYSVVYKAESFEGTDSTKVFLTYNPASGTVSADTELTKW